MPTYLFIVTIGLTYVYVHELMLALFLFRKKLNVGSMSGEKNKAF